MVGVTGFIVDFGIFNLLLRALNFNPVLAQAISFTLAAINNFTWNRYWTYPDSRSKPLLRQFGMFFVLSVIGLLIRTPIFALFSSPMVALVESMQYGIFAGLIDEVYGAEEAETISALRRFVEALPRDCAFALVAWPSDPSAIDEGRVLEVHRRDRVLFRPVVVHVPPLRLVSRCSPSGGR